MLVGVSIYMWYNVCLTTTKKRRQQHQHLHYTNSSTTEMLPQNKQQITHTHYHFNIYGPAYLVSLGSILILADPIRHVLQDLDYIIGGASMYIHNCPVRALQLPSRSCSIPNDCGSYHCGGVYYSVHPGEDCFTCWNDGMCSEGAETFRCLSIVGWLVTVVCTYVGFALFFAGVLWNSKIIPKIVQKWKILRCGGGT